MSFIQVIEIRTNRLEELQALRQEWEQATEGTRTVRRSILARDRNQPGRYLAIVFFDSYESAMENSNLPATSSFAEKQATLLDTPPTFSDLDVIDDRG
ncbi:MAG: antibiotic biosynthesis monooxygenase [Actinobacteria bacterium]|nr:antibiotic biosynthesis monooxygenase [Actinomycetota bacterium]